MNGFGSDQLDGELQCYQRSGSQAVRLEIREFWADAADAWLRAASVAPRTEWLQFAHQRAQLCQQRSRRGIKKAPYTGSKKR